MKRIEAGPYRHTSDGVEVHLDRDYDIDVVEHLVAEMRRRRLDPNTVRSATIHDDGTICFDVLDRELRGAR